MLKLIRNLTSLFFIRYLDKAFEEFQPDFVIYNAGTDILEGDPLGKLAITPNVIF